MRRLLVVLSLCLLGALAGCDGPPPMPQPTGALRPMNPGLWNYNGNNVVPQQQPTSLMP